MTVTQVNANDNTVEGIENEYLHIMSVQYHPEASLVHTTLRNRFSTRLPMSQVAACDGLNALVCAQEECQKEQT